MARHLRGQGIGQLRFDAMDEETVAPLRQGLASAGWLTEVFSQFGNWYLPCAGLDFQHYWQCRPGALRNSGNRRHRAHMDKQGGQIQRLSTSTEADKAIKLYDQVYAKSWQPSEPFLRFLPTLIRYGFDQGTTSVWVLLTEDERPIAAQIWVEHGRKATIFKLAYDQDWRKQSPGTVLTMAAMDYALTHGDIDEIDFGWGDDPYKRDWLPLRRQRYGLAAYNPRTAAGLAAAARNLLPLVARRLFGKEPAKANN
ncbi:MAG: GNAT family N-acetyltransferase [Alphaproteobacteria bacterium]